MNRSVLFGYQLLTGLSDATTGALLMVAPALTLQLLHLCALPSQLVYLSFVGAFVLPVGIAHLYGALAVYRGNCRRDLEIVWLLTAFIRSSVAIFVILQVLTGDLAAGWLFVGVFDGTCAFLQAIGLSKGWSIHAAR